MALSVFAKTQLIRAEKYVSMLIGVNACRALRRILSRKRAAFEEVNLVAELLLPKSRFGLMVDVGAHHGESFCAFAYHGWHVLAFEPDPSPHKHQLIRARSTRKVRLLRHAVSDEAGVELPFYVSNESTGVSSLTPFLESHVKADQIVTTETLARCLAKHANGMKLDFLKIDTEGHDFFVLKGIDWSQELQRPRAIVCEFEDRKTRPLGYDHREMAQFLIDRGYSLFLSEWYPIKQYGARHQWRALRKYPCELMDADSWGNFLAVDSTLATAAEKAWSRYTDAAPKSE